MKNKSTPTQTSKGKSFNTPVIIKFKSKKLKQDYKKAWDAYMKRKAKEGHKPLSQAEVSAYAKIITTKIRALRKIVRNKSKWSKLLK